MIGSSAGRRLGAGGERGRPQRDPSEAVKSQARLRGPAFPAASFPCSWPAEQSGHLSFPCRFWSIVPIPVFPSFSPSISAQHYSLQLLLLMSFLDRIFVCACLLVAVCLSKRKHGEGSFKQMHAENMRIFHVGHMQGGGGVIPRLLHAKLRSSVKTDFCLPNLFLVSF